MQLLLYSSGDDPNQKRLEASVRKVIPGGRIEILVGLDGLQKRLRTPLEPDSIAVLSAANREELRQLKQIRGLLPEIYIILVVPDRRKRTIELAHLLLPRFLSQKSDDFADLSRVLDKMYRTSLGPKIPSFC
jgi:hypothetical protein